MNQHVHSRYMFGSDPATPHQQYVLYAERLMLLRFIPWKFTPAQFYTSREGFLESRQIHTQVPGYLIILFAQWYCHEEAKWKNVCERGSPGDEALTPIIQNSPLVIETARSVVPIAARFYLQFKILPRARKFDRYEDRSDCPEGIEPRPAGRSDPGNT